MKKRQLLSDFTEEKLHDMLHVLKKKSYNLRVAFSLKKESNTSLMRASRKEVARLKTELRRRSILLTSRSL